MSLRLFTTEIMQTGLGRKNWRGGFRIMCKERAVALYPFFNIWDMSANF